MRVVIVGATGNMGTSLISRLLDDDAVTTIVGVARRRPDWVSPRITWYQRDIRHDDLVPIFRDADAVVDLAWMIQPSHDPWTMWDTNVQGSIRVFEAAAAARVRALVYVSSVGAYSEGPRDRRVDESWPTHGIPTLEYSWHKSYVERVLDHVEHRNPEMRVVRFRPALVFKGMAAREVQRLFLGRLFPARALHPKLSGPVGRFAPLQFQAVHSLDVGDALKRALLNGEASGAYNLTAEPPLGRDRATATTVLRGAAAAAWHLRLTPGQPGWIDLARRVPLMSADRARRELQWTPTHTRYFDLKLFLVFLINVDCCRMPSFDSLVGVLG
jgi:UDP-glucose 4-epimerase